MTRRDLLRPAVAGGAAGLAMAALGDSAACAHIAAGSSTGVRPWTMMFDICVRYPAGRLGDWIRFWGEQNVALLEERGQSLWGAWYGLTGQQDTVTHQWAYRDLMHFQEMARMRATDPRVHAAAAASAVPILETSRSAVMTPLPYHPNAPASGKPSADTVIMTQRILRPSLGDPRGHARLMGEYAALATAAGAELCGAFETFFGWTPSYLLHVWRYRSMDDYWSTRGRIAATADGPRLEAAMRAIYPEEIVDLHRPMPYSRLS